MIQGRLRRLGVIVFGLLCLIAAPAAAADDGVASLLVFVPFGVAMIAVGAVRPAANGTALGLEAGTAELLDGSTIRGTLLCASRRRLWTAMLGVGCFALAGLGFLLMGAVLI